MTTLAEATHKNRIRKIIWLIAVVAAIFLLSFINGPQIGQVFEAMKPPRLPPLVEFSPENTVHLNKQQQWDDEMTERFNHISQGTRTMPVPLKWFLALEQPASSLFTMPFSRKGRFVDDEYLLRFGFIDSETSDINPYGLPVGFATADYESINGVNDKVSVVGLNCSACHTAQIAHENKRYIIQGGPAHTDLGQLTIALGAALGQTLVSAKLPLMKARFNRFAHNVLGDDAYTEANVARLETELGTVLGNLTEQPGTIDVVEGYSRLDALNRIGNQVFALDTKRFHNYAPISAPVSYPHIWTASWFKWVQYDGSIMAPLIRNTGEAMGVAAAINTTAPAYENRFSSSVPLDNLFWIEGALAGAEPPVEDPQRGLVFSGLIAPQWPFDEPSPGLVETGRALYSKHCQDCHMAPLNSPAILGNDNHGAPWLDHITWYAKPPAEMNLTTQSPVGVTEDGFEIFQTSDKVLQVRIVSLDQVGTDPATANVMVSRTVDTAGNGAGPELERTSGIDINAQVCSWEPAAPTKPASLLAPVGEEGIPHNTHSGRLVNVPITDNPDELFALALGALVQQVNDKWFDQNFVSAQNRDIYNERRPNCLQAGRGYKARSHDGIWATPPYLHNGSVATVYDLLLPPAQRPPFLLLGPVDYDPVHMGLRQPIAPRLNGDHEPIDPDDLYGASVADYERALRFRVGDKYNRDGYFVLDTSVSGNHNYGHEFSDRWDPTRHWSEQEKGVIGPLLSHQQRMALIEFLKTL